ncbi:MAG: hypothetical protein D3909_19505 [Candidatus Electrothrix sp. ATG1]|nr:hypothetical protein [Candidatus Electrothrix sp. ATG1]
MDRLEIFIMVFSAALSNAECKRKIAIIVRSPSKRISLNSRLLILRFQEEKFDLFIIPPQLSREIEKIYSTALLKRL